ncbi:MAG: tachylectin-related carbohydrate-binding protein [Limisphaerales bacterium]
MNRKPTWGEMRRRVVGIALAAISVVAFAIVIAAQEEKIDKVQQGLVAGQTVPENRQEEFGLLILNTTDSTCSASLLRNDWVITAAHCVEVDGPDKKPIPDRTRPGQNVVNSASTIRLEAKWGGGQKTKGVLLETVRPYDIALIKVATPFTVNGTTTGYNRPIWKDQYPYFGQLVPIPILVFGRGIHQFASGSGASAMPSVMDGSYRLAYAKTTREGLNGYVFWYSSQGGQMMAGGDSGGPSFAKLESGYYALIGVHSAASAKYMEGKPETWDWAISATEGADAPVKRVWDQLSRIMGPLPAPAAKVETPPPFTGRHAAVFENTVPFNASVAGDFNILYGVNQDGILVWHRHIINSSGNTLKHSWNPTQNIGHGWMGGMKDVLPAGQSAIYALKDNGELSRYWHIGAFDGSYKWGDGPQTVGTGWTTFSQLVPTDSGVIYGISSDGILRWNKNPHYADSGGSANLWANSVNVGRGWTGFQNMFSGGKGVLYVVNSDGKLMWFKHRAYLNPIPMPGGNATDAQQLAWQNSWEGPKHVGTGWSGFTKIFSPGEGHIYGIKPNGDLMWYRHVDWAGGSARWDTRAGVKIAGGWNAYVFAFARTLGNDPGHDPK